jgi:hypothetical protein
LLAIGCTVFLLGVAMAALYFLAGRSLRIRRRRMFCLILAGLTCLYIPWGTAVGICTIVVLNRPDVKRLFDENADGIGEAAVTG